VRVFVIYKGEVVKAFPAVLAVSLIQVFPQIKVTVKTPDILF